MEMLNHSKNQSAWWCVDTLSDQSWASGHGVQSAFQGWAEKPSVKGSGALLKPHCTFLTLDSLGRWVDLMASQVFSSKTGVGGCCAYCPEICCRPHHVSFCVHCGPGKDFPGLFVSRAETLQFMVY